MKGRAPAAITMFRVVSVRVPRRGCDLDGPRRHDFCIADDAVDAELRVALDRIVRLDRVMTRCTRSITCAKSN